MEPFPYTDARGRAWHVYDYHVVRDKNGALPINDANAERRAFVPVGGGTVMVYEFGRVAYHTIVANDGETGANPNLAGRLEKGLRPSDAGWR